MVQDTVWRKRRCMAKAPKKMRFVQKMLTTIKMVPAGSNPAQGLGNSQAEKKWHLFTLKQKRRVQQPTHI